jgi:hypothetical protein
VQARRTEAQLHTISIVLRPGDGGTQPTRGESEGLVAFWVCAETRITQRRMANDRERIGNEYTCKYWGLGYVGLESQSGKAVAPNDRFGPIRARNKRALALQTRYATPERLVSSCGRGGEEQTPIIETNAVNTPSLTP